jgi:hypothetical protein
VKNACAGIAPNGFDLISGKSGFGLRPYDPGKPEAWRMLVKTQPRVPPKAAEKMKLALGENATGDIFPG